MAKDQQHKKDEVKEIPSSSATGKLPGPPATGFPLMTAFLGIALVAVLVGVGFQLTELKETQNEYKEMMKQMNTLVQKLREERKPVETPGKVEQPVHQVKEEEPQSRQPPPSTRETPTTPETTSPPPQKVTSDTPVTVTFRPEEVLKAKEPDLMIDEEASMHKSPPPEKRNPKHNEVDEDPSKAKSVDKATKRKERAEKIQKEKEKTETSSNLPPEVRDFKTNISNEFRPKKMWIPIAGSNGGHRRVPAMQVQSTKKPSTAVRIYIWDEFLSKEECRSLREAHQEHLKGGKQMEPLFCFDSVQTLRKMITQSEIAAKITPNDFVPGTITNFYSGESRFSLLLQTRIQEATAFASSHGGMYQITTMPDGIGWPAATDCIPDGEDKRDRFSTVRIFLKDVKEGGTLEFPELNITIAPREGRMVAWTNMNAEGQCDKDSAYRTAPTSGDSSLFLDRWYFYENFYSLGKRPAEPALPARKQGQPRVSCDPHACRWFDEWGYEHLLEYRRLPKKLMF